MMFLAFAPGCSFVYRNKNLPKVQDNNFNREIISNFSKAISRDPNNFLFYLERGIAKHDYRDYQGAIKDFNNSFSLSPNLKIMFHMANSKYAYGDHEGVLARQFLSGIQRRKQIISETPAKQEVIPYIAAGIREASSTLVFCETKDAAETLSEQLNDQGVMSMPYHSGLSTTSRDEILEDLTSGWLNCVVAVRALDEGVDLPEVDCGVIISGTSQKRQMIQRMGRVLRKKSDERGTIFFIVYAKDTSEDPMLGDPDDGYISLILNNAETYLEYDSDDLDRFGER